MHSYRSTKARLVSQCLELAVLLEASADKPGNVNRTASFQNTRFEHFLASAVAARPSLEDAAERGIAFSKGKIGIHDVGVGQIIRSCVESIAAWQTGGNTLLGTVILLSPIAVAAGMTTTDEKHVFEIRKLRENLKLVVESTTSEDAIDVYTAIAVAKPSGLNESPELDVNDPNSITSIQKENVSLFEVFKIASRWDRICSEWVENFPATFDFAYPYLMEQIKRGKELNTAIIHTFLKVLGAYPDTFIARKVGSKKAAGVSARAKEILRLGGLDTSAGKNRLSEFDIDLRKSDSLLNPGTTADIVAAALSLCVLGGFRP